MAKISKSRYKSYGQKQRFQNRGDVLSASIDRIRQQREIEINGLKTLANNEEKNAQLQIRGLRAANDSQIDNINKINNFENKVTANRASAMEVRAEREIDAILGRAKEAEKRQKFYEDFASTHSQNYAKLAQGLYGLARKKQGERQLDRLDPNYIVEAGEIWTKSEKSVEKNANTEITSSDTKTNPLDPVTKKEIAVQTLSSNRHYHNGVLQDVKNSRAAITSVIQRKAFVEENGERKSLLTPSLAVKTYREYGEEILRQTGIPRHSATGREIIKTLETWGRDVAEVRYNANQAFTDQNSIIKKVEIMAYEIKQAHAALDDTKKGELWDYVQTSNQSLHHIIQGAIYESSDGKFGLKSWNPQKVNAAILEYLHPHFKDLPDEEQYEIFDNILNFNADTGKLTIMNGETVGMLTRSKELQEKLVELQDQARQQREKDIKNKQDSDRRDKIAPFDDAWQKGIDGDWTEFNAMKNDYIRVLESDLLKNTPYQTEGYNRLNWNPNDYSDFNTFESALGEYTDGNIDTALIILANNSGGKEIDSGYAYDPRFEKMNKAVKVINSLDGDVGAVDKAALDIYKLSFGKTAFKDSLINEADRRVITAIKHHLMREIINDDSDDPAFKVFTNARNTVSAAFELGIDKEQGIYAATEASNANWTPAVVDNNGKVIKKGGYGDKGEGSSRPSVLNNFVFHNFDNRIDSSVTLTAKTIADEFFPITRVYGDGTVIRDVPLNLQARIETNLNGPNSILSTDEKNFIASNVFNGDADNRAISSNLKVLITMARKFNPNLTTKDVMNMVVKGIAANSQAGYSQLEGKTYPMGLDDITKKITGKCTKSNRNNFALCITELLRQNGVDINNPTSDQILNLYQ
jgi:hypothetical protein